MQSQYNTVPLFTPPSIHNSTALNDQLFLAWLAGFIDGEGCFHIRKEQRTGGRYKPHVAYSPVLMIANTVDDVLRYILERLGKGRLYVVRQQTETQKMSYCLHISGFAAIELAQFLHPYLQIKAFQAQLFMSFPMMGRYNQHQNCHEQRQTADRLSEQERIYDIVRQLNHRGIG